MPSVRSSRHHNITNPVNRRTINLFFFRTFTPPLCRRRASWWALMPHRRANRYPYSMRFPFIHLTNHSTANPPPPFGCYPYIHRNIIHVPPPTPDLSSSEDGCEGWPPLIEAELGSSAVWLVVYTFYYFRHNLHDTTHRRRALSSPPPSWFIRSTVANRI